MVASGEMLNLELRKVLTVAVILFTCPSKKQKSSRYPKGFT
jgi:hypothetical protein